MRIVIAGVAAVCLCAAALSLPCPAPAHAQSQGAMNQTAYADYQKADKELNRVYKKLTAMLDATGVAKLKKAQRAWLAFRDAEMAFAGDEMRGGSAEPLLIYGAATRITEARTKQLNTALESRANR